MKNARFLLACAAASVLAACGSDPVSPEARAPASPAADITAPLVCSNGGFLVFVTNPDGSVSAECKQAGSGG